MHCGPRAANTDSSSRSSRQSRMCWCHGCSRETSISPSCSATRASRPASHSRGDAPSTRAFSHRFNWATTHFELVVPHGHRLADHASVRRSELREERFIPISPLMPTFADIERHLGFVPRFASAETADYAAVLGFVAAGLGIALAPRMVLDQMRRDDVVGVPLAGRPIRRRVDVVSATIERQPDRTAERVTIDALLAAASVRLSVRGLPDRRSRASRRAP